MSSAGSSEDIYAETLAVFGRREDPSEPLTTPEVADSLDAARRTVYKRLEKLVEQGDLRTKKVGANARVWWRPSNGDSLTAHLNDSAKQRSELVSTVDDVLERITDGFYGLDEHFRFTYVNNRAEDLLNLEASAVRGRDIHDELILTDEFEAALHGALDTQAPVVLEDYYDPLDAWFWNAIYPSETGLSVYFRDISDRKRRERQLERFETIVITVGDGIFTVGPDNRFTMVNEAYADMLGYTPDELVGTHASRVASPEHYNEGKELKAELGSVGEVAQHELELERKDGETVPVEARFSLLPSEAGDEPGVVAVVRDISDRKEQERELEASRQRYKTLVENFPNGAVGLLDEDLRYLALGGEFFEDFSTDELVGDTVYDHLPQELLDVIEPKYRAAFDGVRSDFEVEHGGRVRQFRVLPLDDEDGETHRILGMSQDVTERVEYERELEFQRNRLSTLNNIHGVVQSVTTLVVEQSTRDELAQVMCDESAASEIYESAWMGQVSRNGRELTVIATSESDGRTVDVTIPLRTGDPAEEGPVARAVRTGSIQLAENLFDDRTADEWPIERRYRELTALVIPLQHEGRSHGVLTLHTSRSVNIDDFERELLDSLGRVVGHVLTALERETALVADQVVEAEYHSRALAEPFVAATDGDVHIAYDRVVPLPNGGTLQYHTVRGLAPEQYRDTLREFPVVSNVRVLASEGETCRIEVRTADDTITSLVKTYNGRVKTASTEAGVLRVIAELPETVNLREVTEELQEIFPDIDLAGHRTVTPRRISMAEYRTLIDDSLTGRQRATIESALAAGYFEWPRNTTAEELADLHDIHPSTLHKHLRRAEQTLVSTVFGSAG